MRIRSYHESKHSQHCCISNNSNSVCHSVAVARYSCLGYISGVNKQIIENQPRVKDTHTKSHQRTSSRSSAAAQDTCRLRLRPLPMEDLPPTVAAMRTYGFGIPARVLSFSPGEGLVYVLKDVCSGRFWPTSCSHQRKSINVRAALAAFSAMNLQTDHRY